jgi:[acyl-carrier-protein] S-malonyltransferase
MGSLEELASTRICQAAIYVASYIRWKRWAESNHGGAGKAIFAGFSLGEVTALAAAGVFTFEEGLALIRVRGEAMEKACRSAPSTMVTLLGLSRDAVTRLVDDLNQNLDQPVSWLCNELWHEGFVVGVRRDEATALCDRAQLAGAEKVIELQVEGAFHTQLMQEAQQTFAGTLAGVAGRWSGGERTLRATVYSNVKGGPYETIGEVVDLLPRQICSPVLWAQTLAHVKSRRERITGVIVPSPADQIAGMLKMQSQVLHAKHTVI